MYYNTINDDHGCSICKDVGQECYTTYESGFGRNRYTMYQYDYRHTDGELFSCCAKTLEDCRARRDAWIARKNQ